MPLYKLIRSDGEIRIMTPGGRFNEDSEYKVFSDDFKVITEDARTGEPVVRKLSDFKDDDDLLLILRQAGEI